MLPPLSPEAPEVSVNVLDEFWSKIYALMPFLIVSKSEILRASRERRKSSAGFNAIKTTADKIARIAITIKSSKRVNPLLWACLVCLPAGVELACGEPACPKLVEWVEAVEWTVALDITKI